MDDHVKSRALRLAELGYVAFALDYQGGGRRHPQDQVLARVGELAGDADRMRALARAGLGQLLASDVVDADRVAAVGYCFGGTLALELARDGADLRAVVGFHPSLISPRPQDSARIGGSVLVCCGAEDPLVPQRERHAFEEEMREAGVADWRIGLYGGVGHSFTNPTADGTLLPGVAHDAVADRRSWRSMLDLLEDRLGPVDAAARRLADSG